jgi:hypothetical protein
MTTFANILKQQNLKMASAWIWVTVIFDEKNGLQGTFLPERNCLVCQDWIHKL